MRERRNGDVTVHAVSGTHVVFLGLNMEEPKTRGLLGFAIQREDLKEQEVTWLRSSKSFPSQRDSVSAFETVSSLFHPFQAFQWADYSVKPGHAYLYRVFPMYGRPGALLRGSPTVVPITAETAEGQRHSIYFNRAAIASQAYSKRFGPFPPQEIGEEAYNWLARDLLPGMLRFIRRAENQRYGLYAAIYETRHEGVLHELRQAHARQAKVRLIYDGRPGSEVARENVAHLQATQMAALSQPRTNGKIMHNKFIVLTRDEAPVAVWTGSTNLSNNAFFGQLNVGHAIDDAAVAGAYLNYWRQLETDPPRAQLRDWLETRNPIPPEENGKPVAEVFSPHRGRKVMDYYTQIAGAAQQTLFMTFPFGIVKDFRPVLNQRDDVLRYALLEKYVNGGNAASRRLAVDEIIAIRRLPNVGMALAGRIFSRHIDGWLMEARGIGTWVNWVHTKFMLVDPLGDEPVTITGSANWSPAGTHTNDENMVVIRGNRRVADIYFTEFMRIFSHHRFRESLAIYLQRHNTLQGWKPRDLSEDPAQWIAPHYDQQNERFFRRIYLSNSP